MFVTWYGFCKEDDDCEPLPDDPQSCDLPYESYHNQDNCQDIDGIWTSYIDDCNLRSFFLFVLKIFENNRD